MKIAVNELKFINEVFIKIVDNYYSFLFPILPAGGYYWHGQ